MQRIRYIVSTLLFSLTLLQLQAQQKYALLVGINKYYDKPGVLHRGQLHGCVNDAMCMKNLLLQQFGYHENNIRILFDADATKDNLVNRMEDILSRAKEGDAVLFYYSGHGAWMSNKIQSYRERKLKQGMNQAMVMSNLSADNMNSLVRDADIKKIANKFVDKGIVFTLIADCCFSGMVAMPMWGSVHNPYREVVPYSEAGGRSMERWELATVFAENAMAKDSSVLITAKDVLRAMENRSGFDSSLRSFNLKDALFIRDSSFIPRPSERPHSMFASLSASEDVQPALEESDENEIRHGVYTKALIEAVKKYGPGIPLSQLIKGINKIVKTQQRYPQNPQHYEDRDRLGKNLLGIAATGFRNSTIIPVIAVVGNKVILRGGIWTSLATENILSSTPGALKTTLRITRVFNDSCEATLLTGSISSVKPGDQFALTDHYTGSAPMMKLYIGSVDMSPAAFTDLMNTKIIPLSRMPNYMSYEDWYSVRSWNINYNDAPKEAAVNAQRLQEGRTTDSFVVLLPIPSYIANSLKAAVQKNQNVVLTDNPAEAEYILYFNYIKGAHPHFVFTWNKQMEREYYPQDQKLSFINQSTKTKSAEINMNELPGIGVAIAATPNLLIREHIGHWLNYAPRR